MIGRALVAEKGIEGPPSPADYKTSQRLEWDIPLGDVYVDLMLRIHGTVTIGTADVSSLAAGGMERIIRELRLVAAFEEANIAGEIRAYTAFGVNDGTGGRTASLAGRMLAFESLIDVGTPIAKTDPGLTAGAHSVSVAFPIRLWTPRSAVPHSTLLDSRKLTSLKLRLQTGILDTTTAADDTDLLVHPATSTGAAALSWDLSANVLKSPAAVTNYDIRRVESAQLDLSVNANLALKLEKGARFRRILAMCTDDDVLSDARVTELAFRLNLNTRPIQRTWRELQDQAKQRYRLATALAGMNVMDFRGVMRTSGASAVHLVAKVPTGAAVADDRLFCLVETVTPSPRGDVATTGSGSANKGKSDK
jgi:hypothetical protein